MFVSFEHRHQTTSAQKRPVTGGRQRLVRPLEGREYAFFRLDLDLGNDRITMRALESDHGHDLGSGLARAPFGGDDERLHLLQDRGR